MNKISDSIDEKAIEILLNQFEKLKKLHDNIKNYNSLDLIEKAELANKIQEIFNSLT